MMIEYATNEEIARSLFHISSLLEILDDNPYRSRAYRRAAIGVLFLPRPIVDYAASGEELPLQGIGAGMRAKLLDAVNTGHMGVYDRLMEDLGEPLMSLLQIPGIGPKTAIRLVRELGINSVEDLASAARDGRIQALRGFGPKRESMIGERAEQVLMQGAA